MTPEQSKQVQEMAKRLTNIIESESCSKDIRFKEAFAEVIWTLNRKLEAAKEDVQHFQEKGLTLNSIECEGFLRAVLNIREDIDAIKEAFNLNEEEEN